MDTKSNNSISRRGLLRRAVGAAVLVPAFRSALAADAPPRIRETFDFGWKFIKGDAEVTFEIQGEGKLIGLDSGDPASHEDYQANRRKAFNGLCLAIVQATGKAGQIRISATSPALKPASIVITGKG